MWFSPSNGSRKILAFGDVKDVAEIRNIVYSYPQSGICKARKTKPFQTLADACTASATNYYYNAVRSSML